MANLATAAALAAAAPRPLGAAVVRLSEELDAVRGAWRDEGRALRDSLRRVVAERDDALAAVAQLRERLVDVEVQARKAGVAADEWRRQRDAREAEYAAEVVAHQAAAEALRRVIADRDGAVRAAEAGAAAARAVVAEAAAALARQRDATAAAAAECDAVVAELAAARLESEQLRLQVDGERAEAGARAAAAAAHHAATACERDACETALRRAQADAAATQEAEIVAAETKRSLLLEVRVGGGGCAS